jgi:hypothetical protein
MANSVMNYNQFMSACKSAEGKYRAKANSQPLKSANSKSKVNQDLSKLDGKGTPEIQKFTKEFLSKVKSKKVTSK